MRPRSLTARLVAGTAVWLVVGLAAGGVALSLAFRRSVEGSFDQHLDALLLAVVGSLDVPPAGAISTGHPLPDPRFERAYSGWYWQVSDGAERLRSRSLWDAVLSLPTLPEGAAASRLRIEGPQGEALRASARTLRYPSRPEPVIVAVAAPEAELREETRRFNWLLALALGVLGCGLAAALTVQVGYGLRPLRHLASELAAVRAGRTPRLGGDYPREVQPLVQATNDLLAHDAGLIERARRHVGNLAHGLKTPLAVLAGQAARADPDDRQRIIEQIAVMTRLVDHHLTRAAAAGARHVPGVRIEVAPVVDALRDMLARLYAERGVSIVGSAATAPVFAGERQDLEEMLGNVMDNACKWAASRVIVTARAAGGRLYVDVDDDGPGLTQTEAAQALTRGARFHDDVPGNGLGLPIAAELAGLYGGTLRLARSGLGGLRVELELPAG